MWAVSAWLVARSLGIELSLVEAVFVTAVINLGVAIPSSPGFIGTYQWLGVSALALFGVPTEEALAFSISCRRSGTSPRSSSEAGCCCSPRPDAAARPHTLAVGEAVDG